MGLKFEPGKRGKSGESRGRLLEQVGSRQAREGGVMDETGDKKGLRGTVGLRAVPLQFPF